MKIKTGDEDGDIFFKPIFSNSVAYNHHVDDPLYTAHRVVKARDDTQGKNFTRYMADDPVKAVGCV